MKTRIVLIAITLFSIFLSNNNAQVMQSINDPSNFFPTDQTTHPMFKAGGDTIWSTSFDWEDPGNPRGWSTPEGWEIGEVTDFGFNWIWQKDTFKFNEDKTKWAPPEHFQTPDDGFLLFPIQAYNMADGVFTGYDADAYIITAPIDCSSAPSVVISLNQYFRYCCSNVFLEMAISNDDGVHWATYDMTFGTPSNSVVPPQYKSVEINISDVAAGMSAVLIKFQMRNAENYNWFIDDLVLTEAYEVDMVLQDYWAEMNGGFTETVGHINYLPMSQIGSASTVSGIIGDYDFRGAVQNVGMEDTYDSYLNVRILRNGEEVSSTNSEPTSLWTLDKDTLSMPEPFHPDDYGYYEVNFDAFTEGDLRTENNQASLNFTVGDSLYLRSDKSAEASANSGGWGGSNQAGDMVGMIYDINTETEINSLTAYIAGFDEEAYPAFQYVLLKYTPEDEGYTEWMVTEIVDMDSTMLKKWVTLGLDKDGETEFLEPGEYIACVRMWGDNGTEEGVQGMYIGRDLTTKCVNKYTYVYLVSSQSGFSPNKLLMIGMGLNETGGPTEAPITFNVDMNMHIQNDDFHPGSDIVDVAGTFNNWEGSGAMTDDDGDGIYSVTIPSATIGETIEFSYRINANWETAEFPYGSPARTYQVKYWNDLHHVYNNGETTGIKIINLDLTCQVFPNPNSGRFTISLKSEKVHSYKLSLLNTLGKVVYSNNILNSISHVEEVNLDLAPGLYFITIENADSKRVEKVIVR